jgi:nucleoside-diphosphate-sugar epimerase
MRIGKVLVTGAGGLLGSYVVDALEGRCEVSGLDLIAPRKPIPFTKASIEDFAVVAAAAKGQDSIVHIAARPNIWSGSGSEIVATNTVGTWNVLEAAEQAGVRRVILTSSDSVVTWTS